MEKVYEAGGSKFYVLRRVSLEIQPGEFVTLYGLLPGAGKFTLLSIIGMLDGSWTGEILLQRRARSQAQREKAQ